MYISLNLTFLCLLGPDGSCSWSRRETQWDRSPPPEMPTGRNGRMVHKGAAEDSTTLVVEEEEVVDEVATISSRAAVEVMREEVEAEVGEETTVEVKRRGTGRTALPEVDIRVITRTVDIEEEATKEASKDRGVRSRRISGRRWGLPARGFPSGWRTTPGERREGVGRGGRGRGGGGGRGSGQGGGWGGRGGQNYNQGGQFEQFFQQGGQQYNQAGFGQGRQFTSWK